MWYHNQGGYLKRKELTAVRAARATPAMGLEVREVGPIEILRHEDTVYVPTTTVTPTLVALRPKRAETVAQAQVPQLGIDPGRHQPMQIIPSMHVRPPKRSLQDEGEEPSHAQRAAPAAWRPVCRRLPRPLGRANPAPLGARVAPCGGSGTLVRHLRSDSAGGPVVPVTPSTSRLAAGVATPPPGAASPAPLSRPRWPPAHRGPP